MAVEKLSPKEITKIVIAIVCSLFVLMLGCGSYFTVSAGEVGVTFNKFTGNTQSYQKGFYFKMPIITSVTDFDVKTQAITMESTGASKDLQEVKFQTVLNYHLEYTKVNELFVNVGEDYLDKIVYPAIHECMKASCANYPVEKIIQDRENLKSDAEAMLKGKLATYNIVLENINIVDIDFTSEFNKVVEEKQIEEQKIKTAEYKKLQAIQEKEATISQAQGEAEKQRLLRQTTSKEVIQLKWIEAWKEGGSQVPYFFQGGNGSGQMFMMNMPEAPKRQSEEE